MARTSRDGARDWALVMSELCTVPVTLAWEYGAWVMSWTDGPTQTMMRRRIAALSDARVGAPLRAEQILLSRQSSPLVWALAWLAEGSPPAGQRVAEMLGIVEGRRDQIAYPAEQDPAMVAAARLLAALARDDEHQMGALLREAAPPLAPAAPPVPVDFPGTVTSLRWPVGGPPPVLLGLPEDQPRAVQPHDKDVDTRECARCGTPLPARPKGAGRPSRYCGGACRVAAHRQRTRTQNNDRREHDR